MDEKDREGEGKEQKYIEAKRGKDNNEKNKNDKIRTTSIREAH